VRVGSRRCVPAEESIMCAAGAQGCLRLCIDLGCYKGLLVGDCWSCAEQALLVQTAIVCQQGKHRPNKQKQSVCARAALADERPAEDGRGRDLVQASGWRPTVNRDGAEQCEIFTNVRKALV
jgi:hypothetical protein